MIVIGIILLICFYIRIKKVENIIEKKYKEFEKKREDLRKDASGRGINTSFLDLQIESQKSIMEEFISPYERERERLISKIPFLK